MFLCCVQEVAELKEDYITGPMATTNAQLPIAAAGVSRDLNRILSELQ